MATPRIKQPDGTWLSLIGPEGPQGVPGSKSPVCVSFGGFLTLTNVGNAYDTTAAAKGLGMASIDFTDCVRIDFLVNVNKVGSGTQSWQLWNVTDGAELMVVDDAGAAGDKVLSAAKTTNLPIGIKTVRVRAKSTTAADDPVYYGAGVRVMY